MIEAEAGKARWKTGVVTSIVRQTPTISSFSFRLPQPFPHRAGQHVDVRLSASDGYVAMRSYSIASAPNDEDVIELAIEELDGGEVSGFFHRVAAIGDEIELRGPLGSYFVWPCRVNGPVLLIGAGSGLVPLISMLRHACMDEPDTPLALLLSARSWEDVLFREELIAYEKRLPRFSLRLAITREPPRRTGDFGRRIDADMVRLAVQDLPAMPAHAFVCGPNGFVNLAVDGALAAGIPSAVIRTERYGE